MMNIISLVMFGSRLWGSHDGGIAFDVLKQQCGYDILRVSLTGIERIDVSFARAALTALAKAHRREKGICVCDAENENVLSNIDAAAIVDEIPIMYWCYTEDKPASRVLGAPPSKSYLQTFWRVMKSDGISSSDLVNDQVSITNASNRLSRLWKWGYILRCQEAHETGGCSYIYYPIK